MRPGNTAAPVDRGCERLPKTSDETELNNERLDDIAFDNHLIENVYRKGSGNHL